MLNINDLSAAYGVIPVLHGVNLEVRQGEIVALLGGNGAGKTTVLNNISAVMPIKTGSISFMGTEIKNMSSDKIVQLGISQIPEGRKIFTYLTVKENLLMGACTPRAWDERKKTMDKVCNLFPILKERSGQRASLMSRRWGSARSLCLRSMTSLKPSPLMELPCSCRSKMRFMPWR